MEKFLRDWRQDAANKHQYDSAIFIGDKLLALTNDDKDAFWLAQVHFSTGNYTRAQSFLARDHLVARNPSCRYLSAHCLIKQSRYDDALQVLGEKNPTHLISTHRSSRRKLQHGSERVATTTSRTSKPTNGDRRPDHPPAERSLDEQSDLKFEAAMCHLRGHIYAKQNAFDRAKECYRDAVLIDVACFEAFDQLMKNSLMSPDEEWAFLDALDFEGIRIPGGSPSANQEAAEFTRMLYTTRLSKYKNPQLFAAATETLATHYNLSHNADLLLAKAELLFTQCRFTECLGQTTAILASSPYNFGIYPLHLACLHELGHRNALFLLAHDLADHHPHEPCTWLAVGVYYLTIARVAEARRFFSKASMMDPHFGPAWIGFAHTFAAEGEHDQAISAYSTAARLFQGTHLPQMFLGMQNLQLNNLTLADGYLKEAFALCPTDPLLLNEMGVVFYHQDHLPAAVSMFTEALTLVSAIDASSTTASSSPTSSPPPPLPSPSESSTDLTPTILANLGHAHRKMGLYPAALSLFDEVLRLSAGLAPDVLCAKGLVLLDLGRPGDAVTIFHAALGVGPQDPVATDLLAKALEENAARTGFASFNPGGGGMGPSFDVAESQRSAGGGDGDGLDGEGSFEEGFEELLRARKEQAERTVRRRERERREVAVQQQQGRQRRTGRGGSGGVGGQGRRSTGEVLGEVDDSVMDVSEGEG
ncbi:MAG: anaphase promoting complex subunit cdc16 [Caeruleum heppii]|nr:MAG: anaphase promoting complex subunit cdc16 [Caeruleum heppii]